MEKNSKESEGTRCSGLNSKGKSCGSSRVAGSNKCVFHDAASAAKLAEARKRGGVNSHPRSQALELPEMSLETPRDLLKVTVETINLVRQDRMDPKARDHHRLLGEHRIKGARGNGDGRPSSAARGCGPRSQQHGAKAMSKRTRLEKLEGALTPRRLIMRSIDVFERFDSPDDLAIAMLKDPKRGTVRALLQDDVKAWLQHRPRKNVKELRNAVADLGFYLVLHESLSSWHLILNEEEVLRWTAALSRQLRSAKQ